MSNSELNITVNDCAKKVTDQDIQLARQAADIRSQQYKCYANQPYKMIAYEEEV
jgi:hypothetical protein